MIPRFAYQMYFESYGSFTDVVTILLKKRLANRATVWRDEYAENNAIWYISRLNRRVYGRKYMGGHKRLATVVSYEMGDLTHRPHLHIAIERPADLNKTKFRQIIMEVFGRMEWAYGTIDIRDYKRAPFLRYMCKGDFEKIIMNACSRG